MFEKPFLVERQRNFARSQHGKSETRRSKSERIPNSENQKLKPSRLDPFGLRTSGFFRISDFGLRIFHTITPGFFSSTMPTTSQRAGLFWSPTALRAAEPSEEITTR